MSFAKIPDPYFALRKPFKAVKTADELSQMLATSKHLCNVLYEPDTLESPSKIENIKFENVSFSKTHIKAITFRNCEFAHCLFIGSTLEDLSFHDCTFVSCNFFKSRIVSVYAKPHQFRRAVLDVKYANIAVHLYQQLRDNYAGDSQREFRGEAEYWFSKWSRENDLVQARRTKKRWYSYYPQYLISFLYDLLFGYGYRLRNFLATAAVLVGGFVFVNHQLARLLFVVPGDQSLLKSLYFTITTMATLRSSGYAPDTDIGYCVVVINVLVGVLLFSAAANVLLRKVIR